MRAIIAVPTTFAAITVAKPSIAWPCPMSQNAVSLTGINNRDGAAKTASEAYGDRLMISASTGRKIGRREIAPAIRARSSHSQSSNKTTMAAKKTNGAANNFFQRNFIGCSSLSPLFFARLRLDGGDGHGVHNVFRLASARQVVGRFVQALQNGADGSGSGQPFSQFVTNIAGVDVGENQHIGAARNSR